MSDTIIAVAACALLIIQAHRNYLMIKDQKHRNKNE